MSDEVQPAQPQIPDFPEFGASGDSAASVIPVTKVENWQAFTNILDNGFFNGPRIELVYRGQRRHDWGLSPSLARLDPNQIITEQNALQQLRFFRQAVRGRMTDMSIVSEAETDELWSVGQHHGLMTPVLDWTLSPYVALFFAFEGADVKGEKENQYRAIYVMNKTYLAEKTEAAKIDGTSTPVRIYEPVKDNYGRLVNQAGLFTVASYGNTFENLMLNSLQEDVLAEIAATDETQVISQHICKILIPNTEREKCLKLLMRMNIHHASLFPDLQGAAQYCNYKMYSWRDEQMRRASTTAEVTPAVEPAIEEIISKPPAVVTNVPVPQAIRDLLRQISPVAQLTDEQVDQMAQEAVNATEEFKKLPDWDIRETIQSQMRNAVRLALRRYPEFPIIRLKETGNQIVSIITAESKSQA